MWVLVFIHNGQYARGARLGILAGFPCKLLLSLPGWLHCTLFFGRLWEVLDDEKLVGGVELAPFLGSFQLCLSGFEGGYLAQLLKEFLHQPLLVLRRSEDIVKLFALTLRQAEPVQNIARYLLYRLEVVATFRLGLPFCKKLAGTIIFVHREAGAVAGRHPGQQVKHLLVDENLLFRLVPQLKKLDQTKYLVGELLPHQALLFSQPVNDQLAGFGVCHSHQLCVVCFAVDQHDLRFQVFVNLLHLVQPGVPRGGLAL